MREKNQVRIRLSVSGHVSEIKSLFLTCLTEIRKWTKCALMLTNCKTPKRVQNQFIDLQQTQGEERCGQMVRLWPSFYLYTVCFRIVLPYCSVPHHHHQICHESHKVGLTFQFLQQKYLLNTQHRKMNHFGFAVKKYWGRGGICYSSDFFTSFNVERTESAAPPWWTITLPMAGGAN